MIYMDVTKDLTNLTCVPAAVMSLLTFTAMRLKVRKVNMMCVLDKAPCTGVCMCNVDGQDHTVGLPASHGLVYLAER